MLPDLSEAQHKAQAELASAEIALAEATARADAAREAAARLTAAVAALQGTAVISKADVAALSGESPPATTSADLNPEEFDAERKRKMRKRENEGLEKNPLAHIKCTGCGVTGSMAEMLSQTTSGAPIRMMVCGRCNNQVL